MVIRNNLPGINVLNVKRKQQTSISKTLDKLASGYRINRAADDVAGLGVSEKMRAQITGLERAALNTKDAINVVQTAEGALGESAEILRRMKYLAVQATDEIYDDNDRMAINDELIECQEELDRIAQSTNFNGQTLLIGEIPTEVPPTPGPIGPVVVVPPAPVQKSPPTNHVDTLSGSGNVTIRTSGVYTIDASFQGEIEIEAGLDVKLVQANPGTTLTDANIVCKNNVNLFVENLNIQMTQDKPAISFASGNCSLNISGVNQLTAFDASSTPPYYNYSALVEVGIGASFTLDSSSGATTAELHLAPADYGAGIGGSYNQAAGNITIAGGEISIIPQFYICAAFIGPGGSDTVSTVGGSGDITVLGGRITCDDTGNDFDGAMIGASNAISVGTVLVAGGTIDLIGSSSSMGSGIGSGMDTNCQNIYIVGGDVDVSINTSGAGIGSGVGGHVGTIFIDGATTLVDVTMLAGSNGAAIGSGRRYNTPGSPPLVDEIIIRGGTVNAKTTKSFGGAAIGSGAGYTGLLDVSLISIQGGNINASTTGKSAVIGGGGAGDAGAIAISGGSLVLNATAGSGVAIGGGSTLSSGAAGTGANLTITGGMINVVNGTIGGGMDSASIRAPDGTTTISGGNLSIDSDKIFGGINGKVPGDVYRVQVSSSAPEWMLQPNEKVKILTGGVETEYAADLNGDLFIYLPFDPTGTPLDVEIRTEKDAFKGSVEVKNDDTGQLILSYAGEIPSTEEPYDIYKDKQLLIFHIGADKNDILIFRFQDMRTISLGVNDLSFLSTEDANHSIDKIDQAISKVSAYRGYCGAAQNRLQHTLSNLDSMSENLTQAESRIRDMDMAKGMMDFVKQDVLGQSASSMFSMANAMPQKILELLK